VLQAAQLRFLGPFLVARIVAQLDGVAPSSARADPGIAPPGSPTRPSATTRRVLSRSAALEDLIARVLGGGQLLGEPTIGLKRVGEAAGELPGGLGHISGHDVSPAR